MAKGMLGYAGGCAGALALLLGADSSPCGDEEGAVRRIAPRRGVPVVLSLTPTCRLAGDDTDSQARATEFMSNLGSAIGNAVGDVDYPPTFVVWQADVKLVSPPAPPTGVTESIRISTSTASLDVLLMRAILHADIPVLPNFRARCTFQVTVRAERAPLS